MRQMLALVFTLLAALPAEAHRLRVFAELVAGEIRGQAFFVGGGQARGAVVVVTSGTGGELYRGVTDAAGRFRWEVPGPGDYRVSVDTGDGHGAAADIAAGRFAGGARAAEAVAAAPPTGDAAEHPGAGLAEDSPPVQTGRPALAPLAAQGPVEAGHAAPGPAAVAGAASDGTPAPVSPGVPAILPPPSHAPAPAPALTGGAAPPSKTIPVPPLATVPVSSLATVPVDELERIVTAAVQRETLPLLERLEALDSRIRLTDILSGVFLLIGGAGLFLWASARRTGAVAAGAAQGQGRAAPASGRAPLSPPPGAC